MSLRFQQLLSRAVRRFRPRKSLLLSDRADLQIYDIGDWSYGDLTVISFPKSGRVQIGKYCSFAAGSTIVLGGNHNPRNVSTYPFGVFMGGVSADEHITSNGDVEIGNDVWLGRNVTVLSGVRIGNGAIVGAESLVSSSIPPYAIYGGNPAKLIRMRFDESTVSRLQALEWWNWPDDVVRASASKLLSTRVEEFLSAFAERHEQQDTGTKSE